MFLYVKAKHPHLNYRCGRPSVSLPNLLTIVILRTDPQGFKCFFARFAAIVILRINPQGHFLGFGASFYRHTPRLFAIYTGIAVPSRNFIRLLGHLLTSNRKISLFFSSVSLFFLSEHWLCFVKSQYEEKERRCRSLHIDSYAHDLYLHSAKPRNMDRLQRTSIHTPSLHSSVGFTLFNLILHPFTYMVCSHYDRL